MINHMSCHASQKLHNNLLPNFKIPYSSSRRPHSPRQPRRLAQSLVHPETRSRPVGGDARGRMPDSFRVALYSLYSTVEPLLLHRNPPISK